MEGHAVGATPLGAAVPQVGAGVAIRAVATVIDLVVLCLILVVFDALWGANEPGLVVRGVPALFMYLVDFLYYVLFEAILQATPGKLVVGLRIVRADDGGRIGYGEAVLRTLLRIVDAFPYVIPYLLAALTVGPLKRNQRIGDMVAKTLVVKREGGGVTPDAE